MKKTIIERFWAKVEKGSGENDCWEWRNTKSGNGYGVITVCGHQVRAHRLSWEIHTSQPIPLGMMVCHKCDNPRCVRPDHLFLGTHNDNVIDMLRKGRYSRQAMTEETVLEIRAEFATGNTSYAELAEKHNVSTNTIWRMVKGRTWKHLAGTVRQMKQLKLPGII